MNMGKEAGLTSSSKVKKVSQIIRVVQATIGICQSINTTEIKESSLLPMLKSNWDPNCMNTARTCVGDKIGDISLE